MSIFAMDDENWNAIEDDGFAHTRDLGDDKINRLEEENKRLKAELLKVKRELLESAAIATYAAMGDREKMSVMIFTAWHISDEDVERTYQEIKKTNKLFEHYRQLEKTEKMTSTGRGHA